MPDQHSRATIVTMETLSKLREVGLEVIPGNESDCSEWDAAARYSVIQFRCREPRNCTSTYTPVSG
jgi:hypothetical protein